MKNLYLILLLFLSIISLKSCNGYSEDDAILLETDQYVVYTKKENIKRVLKKWLESQKHNNFVIDNDTNLYNAIIKNQNKNPWNISKIADSLKKSDRLNYHTAFLLETNQAYIFNKNSHKTEKLTIEKSDSDRKFKVEDTIILHVIDRIY